MTEFLQSHLAAYGFVLLRTLGVVTMLPLWGGRIPSTFRIAAAMWFAVLFTFLVPPAELPKELGLADLTTGACRELLTGVLLGFLTQITLATVTLAGQFMSFQMGFSIANVIDPATSEHHAVIAQLLNLLAMFVFIELDGHLLVVRALATSFAWIPPFAARPDPGLFPDLVTRGGAGMFATALTLSWPISVTLLLTYLSLGLLTRVAPQMNLLAMGFPITILVGLFVLVLSVPSFTRQAGLLFEDLFLDINRTLAAMRG